MAQGVQAEQINVVGVGYRYPVCLEKTVVCWNKNRRVEFFLRPSRSSSQYSWVVEAAPTRDKAAADLLHIEQR